MPHFLRSPLCRRSIVHSAIIVWGVVFAAGTAVLVLEIRHLFHSIDKGRGIMHRLELIGVEKEYGDKTAVHATNLCLEDGVYGLLG